MKQIKNLLPLMVAASAMLNLRADERRFTYSYEPEVLPKGALEFAFLSSNGTNRDRIRAIP